MSSKNYTWIAYLHRGFCERWRWTYWPRGPWPCAPDALRQRFKDHSSGQTVGLWYAYRGVAESPALPTTAPSSEGKGNADILHVWAVQATNVDEQPFTRSQAGIVMPPGVEQVSARAHDLVDSYGGREVRLDLTAESGPGFEIERSVPPAKVWERLPLPEQWAGAVDTEC